MGCFTAALAAVNDTGLVLSAGSLWAVQRQKIMIRERDKVKGREGKIRGTAKRMGRHKQSPIHTV